MSELLMKLVALIDEVTGLVKEERARRKSYPFGAQWDVLNRGPDFYGPNGTEFRVNDRTHGSIP